MTIAVILIAVWMPSSGAPLNAIFFAMVLLIPVAMVAPQMAYKLGTLHSMLMFMGLTREFDNEGMTAEVIKTSFMQIPSYMVMIAIIGAVVYAMFGSDYLMLAISNPQAFWDAEATLLGTAQMSALGVALILFTVMLPLINSIYAVPMAAAAYGLDPRLASFNGFWGVGYRWKMIFFTTFIWNVVSLILLWVVIDMATVGSLIDIVREVNADRLNGTLPWVNAPLVQMHEPMPTQVVFAFLGLSFFQLVLGANLLAACSGMAFREMLVADERQRAQNAPSAEDKVLMEREKSSEVKNLRQNRMPSRHKRP